MTGAQARLIDEAAATSAGSASLSDIQHVVILVQENRSFDHYFGTLSGVRGFADPHALRGVFGQSGYQPATGPSLAGYLEPFRLTSDPPARDGQSTNDISHTFGPTDSNRLMCMSATIDPAGAAGGPVVETFAHRVKEYGTLSWETMPERPLTPPPGTEGEWLTGNWRRSVTGDLTTALALARPPDTSVPALPATSLGPTGLAEQPVLNSLAGTLDLGINYPLPTVNSMPSQETSPARPPVP